MSDHPTNPPAGPGPGGELARRFTSWAIEHETDLDVWTAVHRSPDSRHIRVIVAHTAAELAAKLETAGVVEP
jgi:hypothetical protein